ncbi:hypothetical protein BURK1_03359 [Burkholderiales bacterium]|nr:hypothetical protein BURK1_03359 [Burkholderiales bacterium]
MLPQSITPTSVTPGPLDRRPRPPPADDLAPTGESAIDGAPVVSVIEPVTEYAIASPGSAFSIAWRGDPHRRL